MSNSDEDWQARDEDWWEMVNLQRQIKIYKEVQKENHDNEYASLTLLNLETQLAHIRAKYFYVVK